MARSGNWCFAVGAGAEVADLASWIGAEVHPRVQAARHWYDTFDWRVWKAGFVLEIDKLGSRRFESVLRARDDNRAQWTHQDSNIPTSAAEFPSGPWRRSIGPMVGDRALVPVASCALASTRLTAIDANGKIVAEALWEELTLDKGEPPARCVRVVPIRGYAREARRLADRLEAHPAFDPATMHPLEAAIGDGRVPGRSGIELDVRLEPDLPAEEAMLRMLRHLYGSMRAVEPWLVGAVDTEFLHDYRIALRRSRSVLKLSRGVLPTSALNVWRPELRDLQGRTGGLRDLDVFVLEFDSYRSSLPPEFAGDIGPLLGLLEAKRLKARKLVERHLGSAAYQKFKTRYAEFLVGGGSAGSSGLEPDSTRAIAEVAAERIQQAHRRVVKRGRRVEPTSPPALLHDVRTAAKELRYALEITATLLREDERRAVVKRLKKLQNLLGEFQDAEVHALAMEGFADELAASGKAPARSIMAIGLLAQGFSERQAELRAQFSDRFAEFDTRATRKLVAAAIAPGVPTP